MIHVQASIGSVRSPRGRVNASASRCFLRLAASLAGSLVVGLASVGMVAAQAPPPLNPPPVPPENPITQQKTILGKMLFWDEQMSSHNTMSCGGCHRAASGGSDPRIAINPGPDSFQPTVDDIAGSPGVVRRDAFGNPVDDPIFGLGLQVTGRAANSFIMAAYAPENFWDGRARSTFVNPETGTTSILQGGGLESQAVGPILSSVEMAHENRTWSDVRTKLTNSLPLGDATDLPNDLANALASHPTYPELFEAAFGDGSITAERIAFAIATYERTLIPNQTPWDQNTMTPNQQAGWNTFRNSPCSVCHAPPTFAVPPQAPGGPFRNIGIRPPGEDLGRQIVTGNPNDRGRFKVPTLRNAGLKPTHMHNGRITTMNDAVLWYRTANPQRSPDNLDQILPVNLPPQALPAVVDFLTNALTDPRVAAETFPFDRPTLHSGDLPVLNMGTDRQTLSWPTLAGISRYNMYRGALADLRTLGPDGLPATGFGVCVSATDPNTADTVFFDADIPNPGTGYFYLKDVIDSRGQERGLGATSDGRPHTVLAPCPPPS
jgi:cytochrome c peroxidase